MLRHIGKPSFAVFGLKAIVHDVNILKNGDHRKPEVDLLLVDILAIQNLVVVLRKGC